MRRLRSVGAKVLTDTVTIYSPPALASAPRKPSGALDISYPDDWTGTEAVACLIEIEPRLRDLEVLGAGKVQATEWFGITFKHDAVIGEKDRVRVTASQFNPQLVGKDIEIRSAPLDGSAVMRRVIGSRTTG